ncbi:MAG: hypothetical protein AB4368_13295 [Xenococcaceae cyanobacterium]
MDILSLSLLIVAITIYDEVVNGQINLASKLMKWFEKDSLSSEEK